MIRKLTIIMTFLLLCGEASSQDKWTVEQCMRYAVTHNHDVRNSSMTLDDYRNDRTAAIGALLPSVEGSVGARFNYGRSTDPETNITTDINTFNNSYELYASLPLFDGLKRYNDLRAARASVLMGRYGLQAQRDAVAQRVFKAFVDVLYYRGTLAYAKEKREESRMLLNRTKVMTEIGTKGEADVAQMDAVYASDDYEVARQQGLLTTAFNQLKQQMNYPAGNVLDIDTVITDDTKPLLDEADNIYSIAKDVNPDIKILELSLKASKFQYRSSIGALVPSISIGAGIYTNYSSQLGSKAETFGTQFRNHVGKYIYASLYVPIFDGMGNITRMRRSRNNLRKARENLDYQSSELRRMIEEALVDCNNSYMEVQKMQRKVSADSLAAHLTVRKYEEGLASPIDVQTARITLIQSKALLLQTKLINIYKNRILGYYKGEKWTE